MTTLETGTEVLYALADRAGECAGETAAHREAAEHAHAEMVLAWVGSTHPEAATAQAYAATGVQKINDAVYRLHRAAELLREAAVREHLAREEGE
ncbi:hypothetical protein GCM10022247_73840 [Allokutzneria multivorans]|uniref:Uncharacterized protein n=1 Tax=Allokutzneria multivorans TaxID=1142134 RepID=A0ABP7U751_9PSEU